MKTLTKCRWDSFFINDVFTIKSGVRLTKDSMIEGATPFIGSSDCNNGITAFVKNRNASLDKNVLGVNYNGSVVENFYHPYEAVFSDDVKRLHLKDVPDNKYILLFVKTMILRQKSKYQYGYKFNAKRMERQKIMLPVDENGEIDYPFMEQYMREIEHKILSEYQHHIKETIGQMSPPE